MNIQAQSIAKKRIAESLRPLIQNEGLKSLFGVRADREEQALFQDLRGLIPFNPNIVNIIYKASKVAVKEKILGRFANSTRIRAPVGRDN